MTMWTFPEWDLWDGVRSAQRPPGRREQIMSRVRHPSFTPDQLDDLLRGLSRRQLLRLWRESGRLLDSTLDASARLDVVVLRDVVILRARLLDLLDERRDGPTPGA